MKKVVCMMLGVALMLGAACTKKVSEEDLGLTNSSVTPGEAGEVSARYNLTAFETDASGNALLGGAIYRSEDGSGALKLIKGKKYVFKIDTLDSGGPYQYDVSLERVDIVTPNAISMQFQEGENSVTVAEAGDYAFRIVAKSGNKKPKAARSFQSSVECDNPLPLHASGIDVEQINVSGGDNLYEYTSVGAVGPNTGGQAPYICAWDFNGDSSRDSYFGDCDKVIPNVYNNYVGNRKLHLIIKDSCNVSIAVNKVRTIAPIVRVPGGGDVFIHGLVTDGTGASLTHPAIFENRVGTDYWALNRLPYVRVFGVTNMNGADSTFSITSSHSYGAPSSSDFGMKIDIAGLNINTIDNNSATPFANPTVSAAGARISNITYSTDRVGDGSPSILMSGSDCDLIASAEIVLVKGTPCNGGTTNPRYKANGIEYGMEWQVRVWGTYTCRNLSTENATATIEGAFEGYSAPTDGCVGGGQGGQGGEPPPRA